MKPHWLSAGAKAWSPDVVVCFDTETTEYPEGDDLRHIMRCWDAVITLRHDIAPTRARRTLLAGTEPVGIVEAIEPLTEFCGEVWIFAHNLNFDLAITQLPAMLVTRKWEIEAYGLSKESNWWSMKRDGRKLVIADSWSWLPTSLAAASRDMGKRKLPLPGTEESLKYWHARCRHDAELLTDAVTTLMDWWDREQLGRWGITGAGCGWQAMRTHTGRKRIVVGAEPVRTPFERSAIYGGRKEVYQVGQFKGEWCADYDFHGAYPTIVAHQQLPVTPGKPFQTLPKNVIPGETTGKDVIAKCIVTTERPCAPVRLHGDVWWPVGQFATVLTGPEIAYARSTGATVEVGSGYLYKMGHPLRNWATWCLDLLVADRERHPALVQRMAKGWSRSVIGRFAGHSSQITRIQPHIGAGWRLDLGHNLTTGRPIEILTIGDKQITTEHDLDGPDCFPAVLAFVEGYCRAALGQMLDTRNPARLLQCNTDGWWERRVSRSAAYELENVPWPHTVVRKACVNEVVILGPDHLVTPRERRLSGVAGGAIGSVAEGWRWHDWPGLSWQLQRGNAGEYVRPSKGLQLASHYARRWVLSSGETVPVSTSIDKTGAPSICSWGTSGQRRDADELAAYQDPRLSELSSLDGAPPTIFDGAGPRLPGRMRMSERARTPAARLLRG